MKIKKLKLLVSIGLISMLFTGCTSIKKPSTQKERLSSLTAITVSPTGEYHPGKFVWHDLITDDVSTAKRFYAAVFGWSFEKHGEYTLVLNQGNPIGGMLEIKPKEKSKAEAVWLPSLSVTDVDKSIAYVKSRKGKVLKGPFDMQDRGRGVLVSDPHGAHLVLLHAKDGDPKDTTPQIGDWLWNEIWTNVPKESYRFYRKLGTYDASELRDSYRILIKKGQWRAGIRDVSYEDVRERWVPVVRVADLKTITDKVKDKGGTVLVYPNEELMNGNVAVITDNTGAFLIVQRWSEKSMARGK